MAWKASAQKVTYFTCTDSLLVKTSHMAQPVTSSECGDRVLPKSRHRRSRDKPDVSGVGGIILLRRGAPVFGDKNTTRCM